MGRIRNEECEMSIRLIAAAFLAGAMMTPTAFAQNVTVDADATVHLPELAIPFSNLASPEAKKRFLDWVELKKTWNAEVATVTGDPDAITAKWRENVETYDGMLLKKAQIDYPTNIESRIIAGVYTDVVTPKDGVAAKNKDRVLIDLHSGGMLTGARIAGKLEAVPVAGTGKIEVIAVDYRQGPENKYPAATEDIVAVYKEVLKHYKPENIGIYGCSAGGVLTGAAMAWFQKEHLPRPGAIGILCAGATGWQDGDSAYTNALLDGGMPATASPRWSFGDAAYFKDVANLRDPLIAPGWSPEVLAKFPPTFFVTGTRDLAMSSATYTHMQLLKQGVDSELYLWDGMNHDFFADPDLPESKEAFNLIWKFFDKHLGKK